MFLKITFKNFKIRDSENFLTPKFFLKKIKNPLPF